MFPQAPETYLPGISGCGPLRHNARGPQLSANASTGGWATLTTPPGAGTAAAAAEENKSTARRMQPQTTVRPTPLILTASSTPTGSGLGQGVARELQWSGPVRFSIDNPTTKTSIRPRARD